MVKGDAVIDGELVAIGKGGVSHVQLLQNALRHEATLLYSAFDLMFADGEDLRKRPFLERKERLKAILPRHKLIGFSRHRKAKGRMIFAEAERNGLEGIMAKRIDSAYASGSRTPDWLKIKTAKRQEVVIVGFTAPGAPGLSSAPWFSPLRRRTPGDTSATWAPASATRLWKSCTPSS